MSKALGGGTLLKIFCSSFIRFFLMKILYHTKTAKSAIGVEHLRYLYNCTRYCRFLDERNNLVCFSIEIHKFLVYNPETAHKLEKKSKID